VDQSISHDSPKFVQFKEELIEKAAGAHASPSPASGKGAHKSSRDRITIGEDDDVQYLFKSVPTRVLKRLVSKDRANKEKTPASSPATKPKSAKRSRAKKQLKSEDDESATPDRVPVPRRKKKSIIADGLLPDVSVSGADNGKLCPTRVQEVY
jgi:hypothetical protein